MNFPPFLLVVAVDFFQLCGATRFLAPCKYLLASKFRLAIKSPQLRPQFLFPNFARQENIDRDYYYYYYYTYTDLDLVTMIIINQARCVQVSPHAVCWLIPT